MEFSKLKQLFNFAHSNVCQDLRSILIRKLFLRVVPVFEIRCQKDSDVSWKHLPFLGLIGQGDWMAHHMAGG